MSTTSPALRNPSLVARCQTAIASRSASLDTPWLPAALLFALACCVVALRLAVAAHGHISAFVVAGTQFSDPAHVPRGLVVMNGSGYDGQFYYRLALEPWNLSRLAHGIMLDTPYRRQRIGYSVLAWLVAFGQSTLVPYALVVVNVVALGAAGLVSGLWARSLGRHAGWGILPAGYFGLIYSVSRDLTEIVSIGLVIGGIVAWRRARYVVAGAAFSGAVLTRETAMVVVAALVVTRAVSVIARRDRLGKMDIAWVAPVVAFAAWEVICGVAYGKVPILSEGGNISAPFAAMARALRYWVEHPHTDELIQIVQLAALIFVLVLAAWHLRTTQSSSFERVAFVFAAVLIIVLSSSVWNTDPREFRTMTEAYVLATGVLLGARAFRPIFLASAMGAVWVLIAALCIKTI